MRQAAVYAMVPSNTKNRWQAQLNGESLFDPPDNPPSGTPIAGTLKVANLA